MTKDFEIRFARTNDRNMIMSFIKAYWAANHILANDQTENLLLAVENIDKYSLSTIKNHPITSSKVKDADNTYNYSINTDEIFSTSNDFLNSSLFTDFDKGLLLSNFDFDQSGLIFHVVGVDSFQETYLSIKF